MYRLFKYRQILLCNKPLVSPNCGADLRLQICAFCNQAFFKTSKTCFVPLDSVRFHSTNTSSATNFSDLSSKQRKKNKRPRKKFTELLQVSDGSSLETRASVSKLKPKDLSALMSEASEDLLTKSSPIPHVLDHEMEETLAAESNLEDPEAHDDPEHAEHIMPHSSSKKIKGGSFRSPVYVDSEIAGRSESLTCTLMAYLDVCVNCGLLYRAYSTLLGYRRRSKFDVKASKIANVGPYNLLLNAYAAKGNLGKVSELIDMLLEDGFKPNEATFIAAFESIGHLKNEPVSRSKLKSWHSLMKKQGITYRELFEKGTFVGDQREKVLNAIERLEGPDFEPSIKPPPRDYTCSLLTDLNLENQDMMLSRTKGLLSERELEKLAAKQLQLERMGSIRVTSVEKQMQPPETTHFYRGKLEQTQSTWRKVVSAAFDRELQVLRLQDQSYKGAKEMTLYPFFKALPSEVYVDILMQEVRKLAEGSETFSPSMQLLYRDIATKVLLRYQVQCKVQSGVVRKMERLYEEYCAWFARDNPQFMNTRTKWQQLMSANPEGPTVILENKMWPNPTLLSVGKFLYNIILRDIKIDVNILRPNSKKSHCLPAFYSLYRSQGKISKEEVKPHPILARLFRGAAQEELVFTAQSVPMLCPPVPWSCIQHGGHIIASTELIRLPMQAKQQWMRLQDCPPSQLYPALDALNQLGSVPWKINESMLDVVTEVFQAGGSSQLDIPEPPSACPPPDQVTPEMSKEERFQAYRKRLALRRKKAEMYSLWCDTLYRLSLANHFRKHIFWLPHNMDFRGRVYPCPPHLNHMGSDMARSILCFARGEPLGKNGLNWLKIHAINLTGLKKRDSVEERLRYAEEVMPKILDSADNPLAGEGWWQNSDEPWQTLACCLEIAAASRTSDPEEYICHFPVHQDGSCNGLQHYAALGRDEAGALSVNLAPATIPQDVYSCVAALVERERDKDAATGVKVAQVLDGFVKRKVIKQTVMTTVYGVTRFGARLQIARQLKDIDSFPKDFVWPASTYLVGKTFESLREMFTSTKEIQDWFTESARLISGIRGQNVEWVTPLGLPIVQPYSRHKKIESSSNPRKLQEFYAIDMFERPNVMKQKNAFPPNFIHSLDSSHMMLTSLFCEQQGITFVSVHDCFWTHPSTVEIMNKVCREQFVALHKQPILEDLSKSLVERYSFKTLDDGGKQSIETAKKKLNLILTQVPPKGSFNLNQVLDSVYFFS